MPTSVGPNTFGEENLVFGYDLGDVSNSYKGEPVENLQTVDEGNVYTSVSTVNTTAELVDMVTPFGNKAWKITIPASGTNGYSNTRAQGPTIQINRDGTYYYHGAWVWMSEDDYALWVQSGNYIYKYSTGSNGMSQWSHRSSFDRKDRAGRTWRAWGAWNARTEGGTGNQYHTFYKNGTLTRDLVFYIVAPMWGVGKSHPVQFTAGTRSATQGLIDLTGNSTIDLTNVSFDSNAQMTFDGTNDNLTIGDNSIFDTNNFTAEAVCKLDSFDNSHRTVMAHNAAVYSHTNGWWIGTLRNGLGNGNNDFRMFVWGDSSYVTHSNVIGGSDGNYHHLVLTCTGTTVTFYIDGEQVYTVAKPTGNTYTSGQDVFVGKSPSGDYWSGEIPFSKIYNRALTAQEVKSNFNAIKGRFNI